MAQIDKKVVTRKSGGNSKNGNGGRATSGLSMNDAEASDYSDSDF